MIQATRTEIDDGAASTPPPRRRGRISELHRVREEMPDVYEKMLSLIRGGAYCNSAAAAMDVAPETFSRWYNRGKRETAGEYRQFYQDVTRVIGQAKVLAEIKVYQADPKFWLKCGPGRMIGDKDEWRETSIQRSDMQAITGHGQPANSPAVNAGQSLIDTLTQLRDAGIIEFNDHTRALIDEAERSQGN